MTWDQLEMAVQTLRESVAAARFEAEGREVDEAAIAEALGESRA
jgi:hypothetical protein